MATAEPRNGPAAKGVPAAALPRRAAAAVCDAACYLPAASLFWVSTATSGLPRVVLLMLAVPAVLAIWVVNNIVFVARTGQSLGKRWLAIRIVDGRTGRLPTIGQAFIRDFLRWFSFGIGWHPFGGAWMIIVGPWPIVDWGRAAFDRRWRRTLHDRWSGTVVIDARAQFVPLDDRAEPGRVGTGAL